MTLTHAGIWRAMQAYADKPGVKTEYRSPVKRWPQNVKYPSATLMLPANVITGRSLSMPKRKEK